MSDHKEQGGPMDRHKSGTREAWILVLPHALCKLGHITWSLKIPSSSWMLSEPCQGRGCINPTENNEKMQLKERGGPRAQLGRGRASVLSAGLFGPPAGSGSCVSVVKTVSDSGWLQSP